MENTHKRQQSTTTATMAMLAMNFESIRTFETTFESIESSLQTTTNKTMLLLHFGGTHLDEKNRKKIEKKLLRTQQQATDDRGRFYNDLTAQTVRKSVRNGSNRGVWCVFVVVVVVVV